jgi:transposase
MGKVNFSEEFKRDAVAQITERGFPVSEVSKRLGVSPHSLYAWKKKFAVTSGSGDDRDAEIRQLKRELVRVTEERDILNWSRTSNRSSESIARRNATAYFAKDASLSAFASQLPAGQ